MASSASVLTKWRPGEDPQLNLFGQLKRIARQWLDGYLRCKGGTYPAQLKYKMLADMASDRIVAGITRAFVGERPIKVVLDPYNPEGSTAHVNFTTSKPDRWEADPRRCHLVEIKGYRREDAKAKKEAMDTYWIPGVNHLGTHGRWAFAELTDVWRIGADFEQKVAGEFDAMIGCFLPENR